MRISGSSELTPPEKSASLIDMTVSMSLLFFLFIVFFFYFSVSSCSCNCAPPPPFCMCACPCGDETRLSAALSDCTHERSQNNNKGPSVGRMKALSPAISAQRVSSPTVSLSDTSHITWRQEGETVSHIWPQQIFLCVNRIVLAFLPPPSLTSPPILGGEEGRRASWSRSEWYPWLREDQKV